MTSFHFQAQASTDADRGNAIEPKRGEGGKITRFFYERSRNFLAN